MTIEHFLFLIILLIADDMWLMGNTPVSSSDLPWADGHPDVDNDCVSLSVFGQLQTFDCGATDLSPLCIRGIGKYRPNLLFGSLQNISAPVGLIEKLRPFYYIKRPIPLLMSQVLGLWEKLLLNKVEREKNR